MSAAEACGSAGESDAPPASEQAVGVAVDTDVGALTPSSATARVLRALGSALLVGSACTFMLQRWGAGNDAVRYLMLLAQTLLIGGAGLFVGARLKESRGARTFLALALCAVPVHFAVLGGLIHSQFAIRDGTLPPAALWEASSPASALLLLALGLGVLTPLTQLAMAVLVRPERRLLSAAYLGLNALLLLPVRAPAAIAVLLALGVGALTGLLLSPRLARPALATFEGRLARGLLVAPLSLLAGRAVWLYDPGALFAGALLLAVGLSAFCLVALIAPRDRDRRVLEGVASAIAVFGTFVLGAALLDAIGAPSSLAMPVLVVPGALLLLALSHFATGSGAGYRVLSAWIAAVTLPLQLCVFPSLAATLLCIAVGAALLAVGVSARQRAVVLLSLAPLCVGVGQQLYLSIRFEALSHWGSLSILGIGLILGASYVDKRRARLLALVARTRAAWAQWG